MLIKKVQIQNFGSLRNIALDGLGDFVVLLGKNGVGKSFLVEAIYRFFVEFNAIGGETAIGENDYLWHGRMTEVPIRFDLTLQLEDDEIKKVFSLPENVLKDIRKDCSEEAFHQVKVSRSLTFGGNWETKSIIWADIEIINDDKIMATGKLAGLEKHLPTLDTFQFAFFTPEHSAGNIGGDRLLLDLAKKTAHNSNDEIDTLVSKGIISALEVYSIPEFQEMDLGAWVANEGYTMVENPPTTEEAPELYAALAIVNKPDPLGQSISKLTQLINGNLKLIQAARDAQAPIGARHPFIEQSALDSLRTLSLSRKRVDERNWHKYRSDVQQLTNKALEPSPEQLLVRDGDLGLPPAYTGGGEQAVLAFRWWFLDDKPIFIIEEPENHLHPELCRQIFKFLKQQSGNRQILLSTHSPMFADKKDITNNWVMKCSRPRAGEYGESEIQQIATRDDLKLALAELGVLPSDIYLKDFIVFVEGGTEKEAVLPILGSKLEISMENNIGVIAIGGDSKLEQYLKIWLEIIEYAPADYLVILDKHSGELASRLARELNIESTKFRIWRKGSIEDYYPLDIAVDALKELFGVEVTKKDLNKNEPVDKELKRILEDQGKIRKGWKVEIGTYVAEKMGIKSIPSEIKDVFKYIKSRVEV